MDTDKERPRDGAEVTTFARFTNIVKLPSSDWSLESLETIKLTRLDTMLG